MSMKTFTQIRTKPKQKNSGSKKYYGKGKRQCELGQNCPYKTEYQHQLEFDHVGSAAPTVERSNNSSEKQIPFIGKGYKLGTVSNLDHSRQTMKKIPSVSHSNRIFQSRVDDTSDSFFCETCKANVLFSELEKHIHSSNKSSGALKRDIVRMEQDEAYEQSLLTDIVEMTAKEEKQREIERQQSKKAEREAMERAMMDSFQEELQAKRSLAASRVVPEPSSEVDPRLVTKIKLRMPDSSTITRRFLLENSVEDLFIFLASQQSLVGFEVSLREVVGDAVVWSQASAGSFRELKLVNCAVVVVAEPVDPPLPVMDSPGDNGKETKKATTSSSSSARAPSQTERSSLEYEGAKAVRAPIAGVPPSSSSSSSSSTSSSLSNTSQKQSPRKRVKKNFAAPSQSSICVVDLT